jgi:diadenosine tetraphosphatase ApaH/serine/threonine PP2A family protein phosphatase
VLALLFDVHGNLAALEAVLADAEQAGAERFLLGGDHVAFGPEPEAVLARLDDLDATWIRGNADRWLGDAADAPSPMDAAARATAGAIGAEAAGRLAGLPASARLDDDSVAWHASFRDDMTGFAPEAQDDEVGLIDPDARRMVVGHTHLQFLREAKDGTTICNPGSVGVPLDGDPRAAWGLLRDSGTIELRRVPYDHVAAAERLRSRFAGAWVDVVAARIARARP